MRKVCGFGIQDFGVGGGDGWIGYGDVDVNNVTDVDIGVGINGNSGLAGGEVGGDQRTVATRGEMQRGLGMVRVGGGLYYGVGGLV